MLAKISSRMALGSLASSSFMLNNATTTALKEASARRRSQISPREKTDADLGPTVRFRENDSHPTLSSCLASRMTGMDYLP